MNYAAAIVAILVGFAHSFVVPPTRRHFAGLKGIGGQTLHLAQVDGSSVSGNFVIGPSDGESSAIDAAAAFMVDAFWLQSPQNLLTGGDIGAVSDGIRSTLTQHQASDFTDKYGERMGKRLLDSSLITAKEEGSSELFGLVAIEARLFDMNEKIIFGADKSESVLKTAVASLGPKQRRQYKDSSILEIVTDLTPPEISVVCVLSNLSVSPKARRTGLGGKLCSEAERIAKDEWEFDKMFLKVEEENEAARNLYEGKLGYELQFRDDSAMGLRVDIIAGDFAEVPAPTLVLAKAL
eukprot:CAMPEP_0197437500 /NCGR_PEP_ID=MMETSP1175-20131217/4734_1 /TAXON_ID=1003142 /ORGANISM="Triceratium dubium, Strain CCMP147" /LENGTH=293 /DNA_ID=CAMNT_0042967045 /DNA_START=161 /DNA_END=1042 /DNA_ORIENTATION=+